MKKLSIREAIEQSGGYARAAHELGHSETTAWRWMTQDHFPHADVVERLALWLAQETGRRKFYLRTPGQGPRVVLTVEG